MKRALLAILILASGTTVYCALRHASASARQEAATLQAALQLQTQQIAGLDLEKQQVLQRLTETRQLLSAHPPPPPHLPLADKILSGGALRNLSATESEQLLAELGFEWGKTGDYLIVSKESLHGISFHGLRGLNLTPAALAVLAITPAQQAAIETVTRQVGDAYAAWAREHVQRVELAGDVLAKYSLTADADFARNQLAAFTNGVLDALGAQRAQWLQEHSWNWMTDFGLHPGTDESAVSTDSPATPPVSRVPPRTTTLTVRRPAGVEGGLHFSLEQAGGSMGANVSPWQPFPEPFRAVFPGGWEELAQREGFELPKEFKKAQANSEP
jgi:hypothetical protein